MSSLPAVDSMHSSHGLACPLFHRSDCLQGVIQPIADDPRVATAYCVSSGTVSCC